MGKARFWVYILQLDSWVRLSLQDGEHLGYIVSNPAEEGWRTDYYNWHRVGELVFYDRTVTERDCYGRWTRSDTSVCSIFNLKSRQAYGADVMVPDWESE